MMNKYKKGEHKGIRWVTSIIDQDSADLVRIFLNIDVQIRHVKNMPPIDFAVSDKEMMATIEKMECGEMAQSLIVSNETAYVKHFASIFEELWKNGIDASYRIRDIEEGVDQANIEIISNPKEGIKRAWSIVKSAKEEVLIMFSSANAVRRQKEMGGLQLLKEASQEQGAKVRVLIPADHDITSTTIKEVKSTYPQVDIRSIDKNLETRITIVLADKKKCVIVELKDDTEDNSYNASGLTTYSDSKSIVSSYVSIFESFWKQSELNEQLTEANEQLKVHDKLQKEFINIAAHELRTPIQPILGLAEVLSSKKGSIEQYNELIDAIIRNARRLEKLTEDILDVTRIESQLLTLNKEKFDINKQILNVIKDIEKQISDSNKLKILFTEPKEAIFVDADKARIYQVIANLLNNAIKFTKEGAISVSLEKKDTQAIVTIKDTGEGIDPQILPQLFSKFVSKSFQGTGLGLFISKSIIEAHGGKIWGENNFNFNGEIGATFYFTLPLSKK
jgi:two-component system, OmpR family, sensor histidine kinase VicK